MKEVLILLSGVNKIEVLKMTSSVAKNLFYQSLFQGVKILMPVITIPIISKALGAQGIGIYSFTNSIAEYFILLSGLGITLYGNREIARVRDDKEKMNQTFSELVSLKLVTTIVSFILYSVVVLVFFQRDLLYYLIQSLHIIAVLFDISWFFMGIEDFKKVSLSNLAVQTMVFFGILFFINDYDDLPLYLLLQSLGNLLSQLVMWSFVFKKISIQLVPIKQMTRHLIPMVAYFFPQIAVIFYTTLSKTILGVLESPTAVGIYTNTLNLSTIIITMISTINLVMLPKMSNLFSKNKIDEINKTLHSLIHAQMFISIPAAFGVSALAATMVPWFFGSDFEILKIYIPIIAPVIIIMPIGIAISNQYLLPRGNTKIYSYSTFGGAAISIILNFSLIPILGVIGSVITSLIVETFVTAFRLIYLNRQTKFTFDIVLILKMVASAVIMAVTIKLTTKGMDDNFVTTLVQIVIGSVTYGSCSIALKVPYLKDLFLLLKGKIYHSKRYKVKN